jgi:hypothetical protein
MCRTAILAIALVALTAGGAHAAPATRHATPAHGRRHAAPAHTRIHTQVSSARKPMSHESGRTAGLAIRRELAQQQAVRRNVALQVESSPAAFRPKNAAPPTPDAETLDPETPAPETPAAKPEQASVQFPLAVMPTSLRGTHESLERQNTRLDAEGLERIEDESDLVDRIARKVLVPLPASSALTVNPELAATHRYCRPWTALFLADLSRAHDAAFHRPLEVSSAVRTMEYQKRLMHINGNAAPAEGDIVSPHLTGATVDIAKDGLSRSEIAWMRRRLLALEASGKIDVEEEFRQSCFHITVYRSYTPPLPASQAGSGSPGAKRHKVADPAVAVAAQGL